MFGAPNIKLSTKNLCCFNFSLYCTPISLCLCVAIDCGPLPAPDDGSVRITSTRVGATATYQCNVGFTLEGQTTRTCLNTGKWSGEAPTCKRQGKTCFQLTVPVYIIWMLGSLYRSSLFRPGKSI